MALEGRAAVEHEEEHEEQEEEQEQNVPPVALPLSVGTVVPGPGSSDPAGGIEVGGIWEGNRGWL